MFVLCPKYSKKILGCEASCFKLNKEKQMKVQIYRDTLCIYLYFTKYVTVNRKVINDLAWFRNKTLDIEKLFFLQVPLYLWLISNYARDSCNSRFTTIQSDSNGSKCSYRLCFSFSFFLPSLDLLIIILRRETIKFHLYLKKCYENKLTLQGQTKHSEKFGIFQIQFI